MTRLQQLDSAGDRVRVSPSMGYSCSSTSVFSHSLSFSWLHSSSGGLSFQDSHPPFHGSGQGGVVRLPGLLRVDLCDSKKLWGIPASAGSVLPQCLPACDSLPHGNSSFKQSLHPSGGLGGFFGSSGRVFLVPIYPRDRKWFRCQWEGRTFHFSALPFGLSLAPWVFTRSPGSSAWL